MAYLSISLTHTLFLTLLYIPTLTAQSDSYTKLVYKGCADQKFQDQNGIYAQNLKTLFSSLLSQSAQKPFATSTAGGDQQPPTYSITGLYQCRGDLTTSQCSTCVSAIPPIAAKLCDGAVAAGVQLHGCYLRYEVAGFKRGPGTQLVYRTCGSIKAQGSGFGERREAGLGMVEEGVRSSGALFYAGSYESLYVLGQCEGDLSGEDCGECVKAAAGKVESECGDSISGQVYLEKCYVSYSYYPNGVPGISSSTPSSKGTTGQNHTQRTVAIAFGGVAALGFLVVCLLFVRSAVKKEKHSRNNNKY